MKRSLVALAVLPLALIFAACEGAPDTDVETVSGAISLPGGVPTRQIPISTSTLVDFDNSPSGAVAAGTMVDTLYTSRGVTFSCVSCSSGGHAYALAAAVGNNAVSLFAPPSAAAFDARYGAVKAAFASPPSSVSIQATAVPTVEYTMNPIAKPFLEAFDASDNLIAKVYYQPNYGDANYGTPQTLTVSSNSASIAYVLFSSQAPGSGTPVYGLFDNLRFYTGPVLIGL
jgi:hypothetical protein